MNNGVLKLIKIVSLISLLTLSLSLSGCRKNISNEQKNIQNITPKKIRIAALKGPTGMGMAKLMDNNKNDKFNLEYDFTIMGSPDDLTGKIISGDVDVAAIPTNLALTLYNKTNGQIQLAVINTLGVLYVIENGNTINYVRDLKGKDIYASGKGSSADFIFRDILQKNSINPDSDLTIDYKLQHTELASSLIAGDVNIAVLPEPFVTTVLMKNKNLRIALDITKEWDKVNNNSKLAMGCIVVQKDFALNNKKEFNAFLDDYKESIDFVNNNINEGSALMEKYGIIQSATIGIKAIPNSNIVFIDAQNAKPFMQNFYKILFDFESKSIGGKLADESFYYKR